MARFWILMALGVAAAVAGVAWYVTPPSEPRGYAGIEFAVMTPAAAARAPMLTSHGALVNAVAEKSPAAIAGIRSGEVVAAIDGAPINSAAQAAGIVRSHGAGDRVTFTLFDEVRGEIQPRTVAVNFAAEPPAGAKHSVMPPRTLAKEQFSLPPMAANAAWSRRIARGAQIRPLELVGLGAGSCNGFAPEFWSVRGHSDDDRMLHVAAPLGFQHALYQSARLNGRDPRSYVLGLITQNFQGTPRPAPEQAQPFGFRLFKFGTEKGAAGFAQYRVTGDRIAVWIAAVAAADASWALPQTGAVVFSLRCQGNDSGPMVKHDPLLVDTAISARCIKGQCSEGDFAASYMKVLRLGFVHGKNGATWLVKPKSDFWVNGAEGPGYYHQTGGENEKLEPGRSN